MVFQNDILAGAAGAGGGYTIDQSIRFNDDDTAYLTRTQTTGDSKRIATFSWWMKRGSNFGTESAIIAAGASSRFLARFNTSNQLTLRLTNGTTEYTLTTNMVFRDPSAWYHCVWRIDVTQATAADRSRLYVNGSAVTFTGSSLPAQNTDVVGLADATTQRIGILSHTTTSNKYDGYLAEFYYIDNASLDASSFGETNDDGVWVPIKYAGTYGTNGFYITGADSANLGADESGNGNNFTSSGLTSDDQRVDTPTNNLMTFNPLNNMRDDGDPTDGNRVFKNTGSTRNLCGTTFHFNTGKYVQAFSYNATGVSDWQIGSQPSDRDDLNDAPGSNEDLGEGPMILPSTTYYVGVGLVGSSNTGITLDTADTIWVAMDLDSGKQWIGLYDNSAASMIWFDSSAGSTGDPATGANPVYTGTANRSYNFALCGRDSVEITLLEESEATGTVPTGFTYVGALKDTYAAPAIADGSSHFNTILYTGDGSATTRSFTGVGFQPDFVWKKIRSSADHHWLHDAVRGATKGLNSNRTDSEYTSNRLTSFDSDGFSFATSDPDTNGSGSTYVAWNWKGGNSSGSSNTDGSITSTVSANTTAGFSVIGYTGNGTAGATVGHGLGVKPSWLVCKNRDSSAEQWIVYHSTQGATKYALLNTTGAFNSSSGAWNNTEPTSSVVTLGGGGFGTNVSSNNMIMYAFAEVEGFSKFGSYTGNGNAAGPFVWCGFRPAFILIKKATATDSWEIFDSERPGYNVTDLGLYANTTNAELTARDMDLLSNGFKVRNANGTTNTSGATHIFMAFAEHPFGGTDVAPVPAR